MRAHSKCWLWSKRVGFAPLETAILPKMSGHTPFAELHIMGENYPQVSAFLYFVGIFTHSIYVFYKKRVGITPLEMPILVKTSGTSSD